MSQDWGTDGGNSFNTSKIGVDFDYFYTDGAYEVVSGVTGATGNCLKLTSGLGILSGFARVNLATTSTRKIAGDRYRIELLPLLGYVPIISFWDSAGSENTTVYVSADGRLSVWRGAGTARTTQIGTSSAAALVHPATMIHIGFDLTASSTSGSLVVYANSKSVITATGVQTAENDSALGMFSVWSGGNVSNGASGGIAYHGDCYVNNPSGSTNNGFDGDIENLAIFAVASGVYAQFTPGGSASTGFNFSNVNETSPDDGVTDVSAATTGLKDAHKMGPVPSDVASIVCVTAILDGQTDAAGLGAGAQIAPLFGPGTTSVVVGTPQSYNTNWQRRRQAYGTNPLTTTAWTVADFNTTATPLQFGYTRSS